MDSRPSALLGALVLAVLLAGCGGDDEVIVDPEPVLSGPIVMTVMSDFGQAGRVAIAADGEGVARDTRGRALRFDLDSDELGTLATTAEASFERGSRALEPRCLDCEQYTIRYGGETLEFDQARLEKTIDERRLVGALERAIPGGLQL